MNIHDEITKNEPIEYKIIIGGVVKNFIGWLMPIQHRTEYFIWRKEQRKKPIVYKDKLRGEWYIVNDKVVTTKRDLSLTIHNQYFNYKKDVYAYCNRLAESLSGKFTGDDDLFLRDLFMNHSKVYNNLKNGCLYFYSLRNEYDNGCEFWIVDNDGKHEDISYVQSINYIYSLKY